MQESTHHNNARVDMYITALRFPTGLLAGLLLTFGSHHANAYDTCLPPVENQVASNIADPYPEGRVNNAAPTPMGVDLPEQGLLTTTLCTTRTSVWLSTETMKTLERTHRT